MSTEKVRIERACGRHPRRGDDRYYACVNGHDYKIESLADLGKRLSGVKDEAVGTLFDWML